MEPRNLEQIIQAERITQPGITVLDLMYQRLVEAMSCRQCAATGLVTKSGGTVPQHALGAFTASFCDDGDAGKAFKRSGLVMCVCRRKSLELMNALSMQAAGSQILLPANART